MGGAKRIAARIVLVIGMVGMVVYYLWNKDITQGKAVRWFLWPMDWLSIKAEKPYKGISQDE